MLQAATAFGGGVWARGKLDQISFPQVRRAEDNAASFKLSLRVVSASIPGLSAPGLLKRERPRLDVVLGDVVKATELGDFSADNVATDAAATCSSPSQLRNTCGMGRNVETARRPSADESSPSTASDRSSGDYPWRFGDTLTFTVQASDLHGPGLRLWLRSASEVRLGPVQVDLANARELGFSTCELRTSVLNLCTIMRQDGSISWESPLIDIPLAPLGLAPEVDKDLSRLKVSDPSATRLALRDITQKHTPRVKLSFSVNQDPQQLLSIAERATRSLTDAVVGPFRRFVAEPVQYLTNTAFGTCAMSSCQPKHGEFTPTGSSSIRTDCFGNRPSALTGRNPGARYEMNRFTQPLVRSYTSQDLGLGSPDAAPDAWVCHMAPTGRVFWHHKSLGPPPWEKKDIGQPVKQQPTLSSGSVSGKQPTTGAQAQLLRYPSDTSPFEMSSEASSPTAGQFTEDESSPDLSSVQSSPVSAAVSKQAGQVVEETCSCTHGGVNVGDGGRAFCRECGKRRPQADLQESQLVAPIEGYRP
eukprot:TRINITY_DN913_c0_g1_i10.p2 TRINITY_DN913_c0_g1~~TRINITY_DN913_c0_g1_i10.p2  ORF type:complete len:531 (-),score=55.23 TRINITY_DN913_c0_g1_i10:2779-4371(-)